MKHFYSSLLYFVLTCVCFFCLMGSSFAWEPVPGAATDISISPEGDVYVLGKTRTAGGFTIFRLTDDGWIEMSGGGIAIAAGPNGALWVVDNRSRIFRYVLNGWQQMPGTATDITVGADGSVYITGKTRCGYGYEIFRLADSSGWAKQSGCGVKIAVSPEGTPWVTNNKNSIYKYMDGAWMEINGLAAEIIPVSDNDLWAIGAVSCATGQKIYHYLDDEWLEMDGCAVKMAMAPDGVLWILNKQGNIYKQ